jgi:hypothetical protein
MVWCTGSDIDLGFSGLLLAATLAALYFSFFKRIPLWLVLLALIPVCGLFATYQNISDSRYSINKSDGWKLMYWQANLIISEWVTERPC